MGKGSVVIVMDDGEQRQRRKYVTWTMDDFNKMDISCNSAAATHSKVQPTVEEANERSRSQPTASTTATVLMQPELVDRDTLVAAIQQRLISNNKNLSAMSKAELVKLAYRTVVPGTQRRKKTANEKSRSQAADKRRLTTTKCDETAAKIRRPNYPNTVAKSPKAENEAKQKHAAIKWP